MRLRRRWSSFLGVALTLALSGGNLPAAWAQTSRAADAGPLQRVAGVVLAQGGLSVHLQDEDVGLVFRDLAARARIAVSNLAGLPNRRISIQFTDLPLVEGVRRLLRAAGVPGYALMTAHTEDGVKLERILLLDADRSIEAKPRTAVAPRRAARRSRRLASRSERVRSRTAARRRPEKDSASPSVFEELRANPQTERLLDRVVHPNEQVRERAIEGLLRLASDANQQRQLSEALDPYMNDLRHGDEETREEARQGIRALLSSF